MRIKIAEGMITSFDETKLCPGVTGPHLAPIQKFVALRNDRQITLGLAQRADAQLAQLFNILRLKIEALLWIVPLAMLANEVLQVARWVHGRVQEHRATTRRLRHPSCVEPT